MKMKWANQTLALKRHGIRPRFLEDSYHRLLMMSWPRFFLFFVLVYFSLNAFFGFLYLISPGAVANLNHGDFLGSFSFSVETFSTIGYGNYYPLSATGHLLVALESCVSLLSTALLTGLVFVKFAKPGARIAFSDRIIWTKYNHQEALCLRLGNVRTNRVFEGRAQMTLLRDETSPEGETLRRLIDLKLLRHRTPLFALSWTLFHIIDSESPFHGMNPEAIHNLDWQVIVTFTGIDEDMAQTITSHSIYSAAQIVRARKFVDMIHTEGPVRHIDFSKLHQIEA